MQSNRLNKIISSQTKVAMRVFHAVSTTEPQPAKRIYQELINSANPVRNMRTLEGCLSSLVRSKLLIENPRGMFVRVVQTDNKVEDKSALSLSQSIKRSLIKASRPPRHIPTQKTPVDDWPRDPVLADVVIPEKLPTPSLASIIPPKVLQELEKVVGDVPEGHYSQYMLPKHDILINYPNSGGVQNYKILLAAKIGDVVRFARPEGVAFNLWRNRITGIRYHYHRKKGILIEAHFYNSYVDLQVMRVTDAQEPENRINVSGRVLSAEEEHSFPACSLGKTVVQLENGNQSLAVTENDAVATKAVAWEHIPLTPAGPVSDPDAYLENQDVLPVVAMPMAEVVVVPEPLCADDFQRDFWHRVFILKVEHAATVVEAGDYADAALALHRARFK